SDINDVRNFVAVDVNVSKDGPAALLTFSRPFFRGYEARIANQKLSVESYRGLFPILQVPSGSHGRLVLTYRPWWLVYCGEVAVLSLAVFSAAMVVAWRWRA